MLTISNLTKKYPNSDKIAVSKLSLDLQPGEIFGFLGKNGAGKSTTIKCVTGILPFDEGEITICGHSISTDAIQAKYNIGYVPDNHSVYEKLTGREYVNYVADLYKVSKEDRTARMEKFLDLFKLRFAADRQIKSYSHGMKQKICIIAALIHDPKLWVLDEPMMGLDPQSTAEIVAYMREHCKKGNTVFFSSHNLDLVKKLCHRAAIINDGKLVDVVQLAGHPENKATLEEKFFRITGTYDKRLLQDYVDQGTAHIDGDDYRYVAAGVKPAQNGQPQAYNSQNNGAQQNVCFAPPANVDANGKQPVGYFVQQPAADGRMVGYYVPQQPTYYQAVSREAVNQYAKEKEAQNNQQANPADKK